MWFNTVISALRLRSAARKYARCLGPRLSHDYGAGEYYTEKQIRTAIRKLGLPEKYIALGFSYFMPEEEFSVICKDGSDYTALRKLYRSLIRTQPSSESGAAGEYSESEKGFGGAGNFGS